MLLLRYRFIWISNRIALPSKSKSFSHLANLFERCLHFLLIKRYHIDPDQGLSWGFDTCVVSVGATRRFAFRNIPGKETDIVSQPHNFVVMDGDVTHMFGNCQSQFQHAVKTSENKGEKASRSSLVFKQCLMK